MYMTDKEFYAAFDGYGFISKAIKQFADDYMAEFEGDRTSLISVDYTYDGIFGEIDLETSTNLCSCCYPDEPDYYKFPIKYLWEDDWIAIEKERRAENLRAREKREAEEKAQKEKEHEERRYQGYLKLKEEYEK